MTCYNRSALALLATANGKLSVYMKRGSLVRHIINRPPGRLAFTGPPLRFLYPPRSRARPRSPLPATFIGRLDPLPVIAQLTCVVTWRIGNAKYRPPGPVEMHVRYAIHAGIVALTEAASTYSFAAPRATLPSVVGHALTRSRCCRRSWAASSMFLWRHSAAR